MKTLIRITILAMMMTATAVWANPHGSHNRGMRHGDMMGDVEKIVRRLERAADKIGLSDDQMDRIHAKVDDSRPEFRDLRRSMRDNRKALHESNWSGQYDAATVESLARAQGDLTTQAIILGAQLRADVHQILTPEQIAQIQAMRESRKHGRR